MATHQDTIRELFVVGARNAHAVEHQAISIMTPQVARIANYPEMADRLRLHIDESHRQIQRLDEILVEFDSSGSGFKDVALSMSGTMAALAHTAAGDEILKNSFANFAFEHFEIASYKSLLTLADAGGYTAVTPLLQQSLGEEESMARWIDEALPTITRRYAALYDEQGSSRAKV